VSVLLRALGYVLLPIVVVGVAGVLGYVVPAALFPHWSADAHATTAMVVAPVVAGALIWAAVARGGRRGR
jgi:hypothetical protein